jgi:hypothetical protein
MRRSRSYTIYDKDDLEKSQVKYLYNQNLIFKETSIERNFNQQKFNLEDSFSNEEELENLGLNSGYKIEKRELTLREKEEIEEKELENIIKESNIKYKNKELFLDDYLSEDEYDDLCKKSYSSNGSSINTFDTSIISDDEYKNIILNNVKNYNKLIKIMLIGNNKVGKSFFLSKIFGNFKDNNNYTHTEYLNIKKINCEINNKDYKLEFWDSNEDFLNSILIKTYFQIAHAFIIIVNENSNFNFIEKQLREIQSVNKSEKIFFIFNCDLKNNVNICENKEKFINLSKKYYFNFHQINLTEFSLKNKKFIGFLESII